jgi:trigger factor
MKGEEFVLEIGSGQFIPGFEDGMVGMKKGEKKAIDLTFPEDYHVDDLKGAKVKFDVELLEIKEKNLPEFTDELAKGIWF